MSSAPLSTGGTDLILIVEDDAKIADMVANYLHMQGYATQTVGDGAQAVAVMRASCSPQALGPAPVLVLLDLMLPGLDGLAVCRAVRSFSAVPIIMVTARVDEVDRLLGLDTGADDYICKPFSPRELVARVKALLRRSQQRLVNPEPPGLGFTVDEAGQRVLWAGQPLALTPVEFRLFRLLLSRPGYVWSRARLLDEVHHDFRDVSDRAVDSHIKNLRRKIDQTCPALAAQGQGITSVYGMGYRFDCIQKSH